jgi:hypothetical protein
MGGAGTHLRIAPTAIASRQARLAATGQHGATAVSAARRSAALGQEAP